MKKIASLLFVITLFLPCVAGAINLSKDMWGYWGYNGSTDAGGSAGSFILAGNLWESGQHGTHGDEWAVVGIIANKIVEHGGYFCPYQLQCRNKNKERYSHTVYYWPNGFDYGKCVWLCEDGYSGENCQPMNSTPAVCDSTIYNTTGNGKFAGLSLKTSGGDADMKESEIYGFNAWGERECDVVLGVTKFLQHGVIAAPVRWCCGLTCRRCSWVFYGCCDNTSYVNSVSLAPGGEQKLLCAPGFKANETKTDCVPITEECRASMLTFCSNFPKGQFDSSIHRLDETSSSCAKYFCKEPNKAFPSLGNVSCEPCGDGVKGGADTNTGVCVECETGEYFNQNTNRCEIAAAYSKTDMQYGKNQTNNTIDIDEQCWTILESQEYSDCVKGIKSSSTSTNSSN